jgi:hypothetical protein
VIRGPAIVGVCGANQESAIPRGAIQRSAIRGKSVYAGKLCGDGNGGGARKRKNERHNATSNNLTRKHTNSTMQIIERKCKAQKVPRTVPFVFMSVFLIEVILTLNSYIQVYIA